jgi:hypothetical protein
MSRCVRCAQLARLKSRIGAIFKSPANPARVLTARIIGLIRALYLGSERNAKLISVISFLVAGRRCRSDARNPRDARIHVARCARDATRGRGG